MTGSTAATVTGLLLLAAYVIPLYVPPGAQPITLVTPATPLLERVFPGVPSWWILARLLCVAAGAVLLAWPVRHAARDAVSSDAVGERAGANAAVGEPASAETASRLLLAAGAAACILAAFAHALPRAAQIAFVAALLLVPCAAMAVGTRASMAREQDADRRLARWMSVPLAVAWLVLRVPSMAGSPLLADAIDYQTAYGCYQTAADPAFSVLTDGCWPGYTAGPMLLHGVGLLGWGGVPLSMAAVQNVAALWTAVSGALLGLVAARVWGAGAGVVAAAVFLWSPIVLLRQFIAGQATYTTFTVMLLATGLALLRSPSAGAAALYGALLGLAAHLPNLVVVVPFLGLLMLGRLWRHRALVSVGLLFFCAGITPGITTLPKMFEQARTQSTASVAYAPLESFYMGRVAPSLGERGAQTDRSAGTDILVGLAASPLAVARSPMRLWGDTVVEPIGAALAMVGLAGVLASLRSPRSRFLVAFLLACLLPGVASSYDRVIPIRFEIVVPIVLLAAQGLSMIAARLHDRPVAVRAALPIAIAAAASGSWLFDRVHAQVLSPSAAGLAVRAGAPMDHAVLWSRGIVATREEASEFLGRAILGRPFPVWSGRREDVARASVSPEGFFWTPGEQMDRQIGREVCSSLPKWGLFEATDATGRTRLFAARPEGRAPDSGASVRWERRSCDEILPTDATAAAAALEESRRLVAEGRTDDALETLRRTATRSLVQPRLYHPLAELLARRGRPGDRVEARFWSDMACRITDGSDYRACILAGELRSAAGPR